MRSTRSERRWVLSGNLERVAATRGLWCDDAPLDPRREARVEALRRAIRDALTDKQREVIEAFYFEGRSQGEIARALGISQQVVNKRLFGDPRGDKRVGGAIARLRRALCEPAGPCPS